MKRVFITKGQFKDCFFDIDKAEKWALKEAETIAGKYFSAIRICRTINKVWILIEDDVEIISNKKAASLFLQNGYGIDELPKELILLAKQLEL